MSHVWVAQRDGDYCSDTQLGVTRTKAGAQALCQADAFDLYGSETVPVPLIAWFDYDFWDDHDQGGSGGTSWSVQRWEVSET